MDGAKLHAKVYEGRGKVAKRIGLPCDVYRPQNSTAPLTNKVTTLLAAFNAVDPTYTRANLYGKPVWYADLDGRLTCPGDYLIRSDAAIWFVGAQEQLLPIVAIDCNGSVHIQRTPSATSCGTLPYSSLAGAVDVLGTADSPWPASILIGGRALSSLGLPGSVKDAGWRILLPHSIPCRINAGDIAIDNLQRRFAIESAEVSDLGWRLTANEVHP